jgi:PAS domain S-box-containing protein
MTIQKFFFDRSIRTKISAAILVVLFGVCVFNLLFFPAQQRKLALEGMQIKGESMARMLAYNLSPALDFDDLQSMEELAKGAFQDRDLSFIRILRYQYNDTIFFQPENLAHAKPEFVSFLSDSVSRSFIIKDRLYVTTPIKAGQLTLGMLRLSFSLQHLEREIARRRSLVFGSNILILILGIIMANRLSYLLTKPIHKLIGAALQISKGEWGVQVSTVHADEIGVLANTFNRMSQGLKESKDKLEEYSLTLEQKVEERTEALISVNQELAVNEETITKMLEDLNLVNQELTQTKNQLENIFKSVVDRAIITIDTEGRIIFYSQSSELVFGYEASEVVGKMWIQDFFSPEKDFLSIFLEHTREAGIYKGETELMRRSKEVFPAMVAITPLKGEGGILVGYTFMVEDVTQKKKTEERIRLLSFAVESATDGAMIIDLNGKIVFVNLTFAHMHGYKPYEMIGKFQKDFYPQSHWSLLDQAIQQIYTEGSWSAELEEPRKDKITFPVQISASLIKDSQGRPMGILGIYKDISEKKKMEQEILQSNRELSALNIIGSTVSQTLNLQEILNQSLKTMLELTSSPAGWIFFIDREDKNRMELVAHYGLSERFVEEELKLRQDNCLCWEVVKSKKPRLLDLTHCPRLNSNTIREEKLRCHIAIPLRSKDQVLGVMNLSWHSEKDFSEREMEFFSSVGNEIGIAVDNALLFEDVEKAKKNLQKLNRKLEEASQIKSEFLANTSHELRTPLNSIIGFLGLVLDEYCVNREEEREFLCNAQKSAKHLLSIINDVLDLAKIEAGKMTLELSEVNLMTLFEEVHSLVRAQTGQKKLKVSFIYENHPAPRAYADSGKLRQVMINLIGNAIKFTDKGEVIVRSKVCEEKGNVLIEVEDTGIGVPSGIQDQLFEKFRQGDGSSTRKHGGTGLGLTITKNLVEMMGGKIKLESPGEGKGTRVSFTVPIYREGKKGESLHEGQKSGEIKGDRKSSLALIVEDDPLFSHYLDDLLQGEGFATILARTADDAVTLAKELHPHIILLDFSLPQKEGGQLKDGGQVVQMLLKDPNTRNIPVTIITGQDLDQVKKELSQFELESSPQLLAKPVTPEVLLEKISVLSDKRREEMLVCKDT